MKKIISMSIVFTLILMSISCVSKGGGRGGSLKTTLGNDEIDMTITAEGEGVIPKNTENEDQARLLAIRAAKMDAYRNLTEKISGITLSSGTTIGEYMTANDTIRGNVHGFIKNAQMDGPPKKIGGTYKVTLKLHLGRKFTKIIMKGRR
jgi:hypothetical protein